MKCPMCGREHPLRKHGAYVRYFCDLGIDVQQINILRYYCSGCGGTVSFLPSFAVPRKQFSARIISICLQLILACGLSFKGVTRAYPCVSRVLVWSWIKKWYYNSKGIISVMRNYLGIQPQKSDICSYHHSRYISEESLEAFFIVSDFVIGDEICGCAGDCNAEASSCVRRYCFGILEGIQKRFSRLPFFVELL